MFDELVESSASKKKTHKPWAVALSAMVQVAILIVLILIPLIYTQALPKAMLTTFLVAPPPPPPPPPPMPKVEVIKPVVHLLKNNQLTAPSVIPKKVEIVKEDAPPPDAGGPGVFGGTGDGAGGILGGLLGGTGTGAPPPPKPTAPQRIRVGGAVQQARMIRQVQPVYPPIAKTAHVQGSVILHAIIAKDGTIQELQYVSGPPLLMKSAMDAVKEWRYAPTLLNGEPVEVDTTISVIFTLGG
jgi:protein TonB